LRVQQKRQRIFGGMAARDVGVHAGGTESPWPIASRPCVMA
jgi:hypothetical protein